jgi:VWFA-related protein
MHGLPKILLLMSAALAAIAGSEVIARQAQSPDQRPGPPGTIRVRVRLVPVDVIVTDSRDRPVTDLKQEDFQIFEDGRLQEIRHFSLQTFTAAKATEPASPPILRAAPAAELAPQSTRTFLILMGRGWHQRTKAVDALIRFVRGQLLPQDRIALFAYNRATDFTTDHERIAQVIERYKSRFEKIESALESRFRGLAAIYGSREIPKSVQSEIDRIFAYGEKLGSRQFPPALPAKGSGTKDNDATQIIMHSLAKQGADSLGETIAASGNEVMAMDALTGSMPFDEWAPLNAGSNQDTQNIFTCIEYLRYMEGEKHLLFFSEQGLFVPFGNMDPDHAIARVANDARVAVDTFQTGGIYLDLGIGRGPVNLAAKSMSSPARTYAVQGLRSISQLTGGRASVYADIGNGLKTVNETTCVEYLLGYYPKNDNWDGNYRRIRVKVNRPGLKVFFRQGYFARETIQPFDREEFLAYSRITAAGGYEPEIMDIPFRADATGVTDAGAQNVKVDLWIDLTAVGFKTVNGRHAAKLRVAIFYADEHKKYIGETWNTITMDLKEQNYQTLLLTGLTFTRLIPLATPKQILKIVVYDSGSDKVGSRLVKLSGK